MVQSQMPNSVEVSTPWVSTRPVWALRSDSRPLKKAGERRHRWDSRHHCLWKNDYEFPNGRSYFDRMRDADSLKVIGPRSPLRPVWVLDVSPEEENIGHVFNARTASFKAKPGLPKTEDEYELGRQLRAEQLEAISKVTGTVSRDTKPVRSQELGSQIDYEPPLMGGPSATRFVRTRTPRNVADLRNQRKKEKEWHGIHGTVFSRFNNILHPNYRSYFDRWKDADGPDVREPTWKLAVERRSPLAKSSSEPSSLSRHSMSTRRERAWQVPVHRDVIGAR